jgi:hypothetical protein
MCQRVLTQTSRDTRLSDPLANVRPLHIGPHCVNIAQIGEVMKCLPAPISLLTRSAQIHLPSDPVEPHPYAVERSCRDHGDTVGPAVGVPTGGDHHGVQELLTELAAQPVQVPEFGDVLVDDAVEVAVELGPQRATGQPSQVNSTIHCRHRVPTLQIAQRSRSGCTGDHDAVLPVPGHSQPKIIGL